MTREELIQSLRCCASDGLICARDCPAYQQSNECDCADRIKMLAAAMLEQDGPDNNVGAKSADDMFRDAGYEQRNIPGFFRYVKKNGGELVNQETISVSKRDARVEKSTIKDGFVVSSCFPPLEIRAICKLLDEMEMG